MRVCLQKPQPEKFIFGLHIHLQTIWVKFIYKGHWVDITVTRAKCDPANVRLKWEQDNNCNDGMPTLVTRGLPQACSRPRSGSMYASSAK